MLPAGDESGLPPWRRVVLAYAPAGGRAGLAALLALDDALAAALRTTRDPMARQFRLTWWRDALAALDTRPAPAEPVLRALARHVVASVPGAELTVIVDGWEELLDPDPVDADRLDRYADGRGRGLFGAAARLLGADIDRPLADAGRGWALADLAAHVRDEPTRRLARAMAAEHFARMGTKRWRRAARPLGAMAHLARLDGATEPVRLTRALWHWWTGR